MKGYLTPEDAIGQAEINVGLRAKPPAEAGLLPCPFCGGEARKSSYSDLVTCGCLRASNTWIPVDVWQMRVSPDRQDWPHLQAHAAWQRLMDKTVGVNLADKAVQVMGSVDRAYEWLTSVQPGLGGAVPTDHARTEAGRLEVEGLLGRIEHGVFS